MTVKTTIDAFICALQHGDAAAMEPLFAAEAVWRVTPDSRIDSKPLASSKFGPVAQFIKLFRSWAYEPYNILISEDEGKAFVEARVEGDEDYVNEVMMSFELENDKISYLREYLADGAAAAV
jgi:ketosteroid isomerase-like protein